MSNNMKQDPKSGLILPAGIGQSRIEQSNFKLLDMFEEITQLSNKYAKCEAGSPTQKDVGRLLYEHLEIFKHNLAQADNFVRNCKCQSLKVVK